LIHEYELGLTSLSQKSAICELRSSISLSRIQQME
jgi:hypothetical protein